MQFLYKILIYLQALIWFCFGLFGKLLPADGRHQQIIEEIFNLNGAGLVTNLIGIGEIGLAVWIITFRFTKLTVILQIILILTMNVIEYTFADGLLLWGKWNLIFSIGFSAMIGINEFLIKK